MKKARIAITSGDPAGVGPELIRKCLEAETLSSAHVTVFGPKEWLETLPNEVGTNWEKIAIGSSDSAVIAGKPTEQSSQMALQAMESAALGCVQGRFDGVVTGPISKARCAEVGFSFPGQTEFFAHHWGGEPTMGFVGERLKVVLATWHLPLASVPSGLTEERVVRAIERANQLAIRLGCSDPRIGVCGLNPHAGEEGLLGSEEKERLNPLLRKLRPSIPGLSECLPGDTVFHRALKGEFDVVVAMYHDQGLAPLKTIEFDTAVNVTLGLKYIRTSPDHGTGFDIAGKEIASPKSFLRAIQLAVALSEKAD